MSWSLSKYGQKQSEYLTLTEWQKAPEKNMNFLNSYFKQKNQTAVGPCLLIAWNRFKDFYHTFNILELTGLLNATRLWEKDS